MEYVAPAESPSRPAPDPSDQQRPSMRYGPPMRAIALLPAALLAACPLGTEPDPEPTPPAPFLGVDPAVPAGADEARAGVVREGEEGEAALFGGINAEGRAGDVKIYNDRVQFVVQAARRSHGVVDVGGGIIDADLVRTDGTLGRDTLEDSFLSFSLARLAHAESVEILSDGSDGGPAVVRATGHDVPWNFMQGLFELPEPNLPDLHLAIETDYRLEPGRWSLEATTRLTNEGDEPVEVGPRDGMFASGEDLLPWSPGRGLAGPSGSELAAVGVVGREGEASLSLWPDEGTLSSSGVDQLAAELGLVALSHERADLAPGETRTLTRFWTIAPDVLTAEAERWRHQGRELEDVSGLVRDSASGDGVPGVRVWFTAGDDVAGEARTDRDGRYQARLPPGSWTAWTVAQGSDEHFDLPPGAGRTGPFASPSANAAQRGVLDGSREAPPLAWAAGRATPEGVEVVVDALTELDLVVPPPSAIHLDVVDEDGAPLPAVVELRWASEQPAESPVPAALREALGLPQGGRAGWAWTTDGTLDIPAIPGAYVLRVGHGWRHDQRVIDDVVVTEGQPWSGTATLAEVVPRDGWLSLDPHLHAAPSFDGALAMEARLATCAATGLELPVTTDHDRQADYRPLASAMGLDGRLRAIPGVEVTTILRGHFNLYPVEPDPDAINGGAEPWWITPTSTQALFDRMQERAGPDALTQVNHPRSPGMFALGLLDPATGEPGRDDLWSWDFELFELLNGGVEDLPALRRDWFALLDVGRVRVPMGASDSHYAYIPCGHGRTDVWLDADGPGEVSASAVRGALLAGHVVVAGGTTLRAALDLGDGPLRPGDTGVGAAGELAVTVQAPAWIEPGILRVYRNGEVVHEELLAGPGPVWFDDRIAVSAAADSWFAVEVEGTASLGPLWRGFPPYAMTNAFFVDVDGDGWAAPRE